MYSSKIVLNHYAPKFKYVRGHIAWGLFIILFVSLYLCVCVCVCVCVHSINFELFMLFHLNFIYGVLMKT